METLKEFLNNIGEQNKYPSEKRKSQLKDILAIKAAQNKHECIFKKDELDQKDINWFTDQGLTVEKTIRGDRENGYGIYIIKWG